ncbi:MAG: Rossmann-like and DUF2520 domain-containing protein [Acidobacteriaceae bacterium]
MAASPRKRKTVKRKTHGPQTDPTSPQKPLQSRAARANPRGLPAVTLIGFGYWGSALALALRRAGIALQEVVVRPSTFRSMPSTDRKFVSALGAKLTTLQRSNLDADILWICTPDATIAKVAAEVAAHIAELSARKRLVFHSSGALPSGELAALQAIGASAASVHPLMTFPGPTRGQRSALADRISVVGHTATSPLAGVPFAIEGDAPACRVARQLVRKLQGLPFPLEARNKPIYHAFGTLASPLLISLLTAARDAAMATDYTEEQARRLLRPIVEQTVANFFANGPAKSFSGPFARGDAATISRHLKALRHHADLLNTYRQLGLYALTSLPVQNKRALHELLNI